MAHFNFVISQNAKWGHAGFYIYCHRMTVPENILLQKSTAPTWTWRPYIPQIWSVAIKHSGVWYPDVLILTVTGKLLLLLLFCLELGSLHSGAIATLPTRTQNSLSTARIKASSHRHARHDTTVLSVSRPLRRCERDSRQLKTVADKKFEFRTLTRAKVQFTPAHQTRHRQNAVVSSGLAGGVNWALVSLPPIKSWRWRAWPTNASCNWVDLLQVSSAECCSQFMCCHQTLRPMSHVRFYRALLSHECATLSRDKVADAATVELHTATLSHKQTRLLHHFSRFTILLRKHSSKM